MEDVPPIPQPPEGSKAKKPFILPPGCWFFLWCCAGLAAFGAFCLYQFGENIQRVRAQEAGIVAIATANGLEQFRTVYGTFPLPHPPSPSGSDTDTDTSSAHPLISILMGKEPENETRQNPRSIYFLEGIKAAAKPQSPKQVLMIWVNGLFLDEETGHHSVVDAWGTPYRVRLDTNNDKTILNPNPDQVAEGRTTLPKYVLVWSAGKDRDWNTWEDNPMSWD